MPPGHEDPFRCAQCGLLYFFNPAVAAGVFMNDTSGRVLFIRRAKDHLKGSLMLSLESTSSRMSNLARQEIYFKKFFTLDELGESIENVTEDDVQRIAREFFEPKSIALTILGNLDGFKIGREELAC